MRRFAFFVIGIFCGLVIGGVGTLLMTPASGDSLRDEARNRFDDLLDEARMAGETRRAELERQLADLTTVKK